MNIEDSIDDPWKFVLPLLEGGWAKKGLLRWRPPSKNLLIFVSSTFTDSHLERDILAEQILPNLQIEAQKHGMMVTLTDMRYGVIEANQRNHRVWEYCKAELVRCHRDSAGLFFLSLQSSKYGYRPIPRSVESTKFEERVSLIVREIPEAILILQRWYYLDCNSLPPRFTLKYIANKIENEEFWNDFPVLHQALAEMAFEDDDPSILVGQSITEWETRFALTLCSNSSNFVSENHKEIIWIERLFPLDQLSANFDPQRQCADFHDSEEIKNSHTSFLQYMDCNFQHHIRLTCPSLPLYLDYANDISHQCSIVSSDTLGQYAKEWSDKLNHFIENDLEKAIQRRNNWKGIPGVENIEEMLHHGEWAELKAESFVGREQLVSELMDAISLSDMFLTQSKPLTCAVIGFSGCGKTALMAKVAQLAYLRELQLPIRNMESNVTTPDENSYTSNYSANQLSPNAISYIMPVSSIDLLAPQDAPLLALAPCQSRPVLIRFCGTSPDSSDAFTLVRSICMQLSLIFNQPSDWHFATSVTDYFAAVEQFQHLLQVHPVILFIDSLDQLSDAYQGRSRLSFLANIQPHPDTRIIVSTLPDEQDPITKEWLYCYQCESRLKEWQIPILEVRSLGVETAVIRREEALQQARNDESHSESVLFADIPHIDDASCWDSDEYEKMLRIILQEKYQRTCTPQQIGYVLRQAAEEPSVLYLQLACRVIANWTSIDFGVELASGVTALIYQIFSGLEFEYGTAVTRAALGFLTFAKAGVTDNEMQNLLTLHPGVITEVDAYHTMRRPRLPFHVWSRLRSALEGLIVEKQDGCLRWYHRQLQETAERRYSYADTTSCSNFGLGLEDSIGDLYIASSKERLDLHSTMAMFFGNAVTKEEKVLKLIASQPLLWGYNNQSSSLASESPVGYDAINMAFSSIWASSDEWHINRRRCVEASYHLASSVAWILRHHPDPVVAKHLVESMIQELCQPVYVCACSKTGNLVAYLQDLRNLRSALDPFKQIDLSVRIRLDQYIRWIRMYIGVLIKDPETQIPYSLSEMAEEYTELGNDYERLLKERHVMICTGHEAPDGPHSIHSINETQGLEQSLVAVSQACHSCQQIHSKSWVFPVIWKVERSATSARPEMTLSGCKEHIMAIVASPTNSQIAISYQSGIIEIWDVDVGICTIVMEGGSSLHGAWLSYTSDGKKLVSMTIGWFKMGVLEVWDAKIGYRLLYHHDIRLSGGLFCTPDKHHALVGCKNGTVEMWSLRSASCKTLFKEEYSQACAVSAITGCGLKPMSREYYTQDTTVDMEYYQGQTDFIFAVGYDDGHITLWNLSDAVPITTLVGYEKQPIRVIQFSHNGERLTSSSSPSTPSLAWTDQTGSMSLVRIWKAHDHNSFATAIFADDDVDENCTSTISIRSWRNPKRLQEIMVQGTCLSLAYSMTPRDRILITLENDQIVCRDADSCEAITSVTAARQVNLLCGNLLNGAYVTTTDDGHQIHVWSPDIHLDFDENFRTPGRVVALSQSLSRTWSSVSMLQSPFLPSTRSFLQQFTSSSNQSPITTQQILSDTRTTTLHRKRSDHSLHRFQSEKSILRISSEKSLYRMSSERSMPRFDSDRSLHRYESLIGSFYQNKNVGRGDLTTLDTFTIPEIKDKDGDSLEYISSSDEEEDGNHDDDDYESLLNSNKRSMSTQRVLQCARNMPIETLEHPLLDPSQAPDSSSSAAILSTHNMDVHRTRSLRYAKSMPTVRQSTLLKVPSNSTILEQSRECSSTTNGIETIVSELAGEFSSSNSIALGGVQGSKDYYKNNSKSIYDSDDRIDAVCVHPDGKHVAVARHKDSHITMWSLDGHILLDVLPDFMECSNNILTEEMICDLRDICRTSDLFRVIFLRFLQQGQRILMGLQCGLFVIWNVVKTRYELAHRFREMCNPRFINVSPDDRHLIPNFYAIWNMETGEIVHRPQNSLEYKVSVFSNTGDKALLICAKETGSLIVYDARQVLVLLDLITKSAGADTSITPSVISPVNSNIPNEILAKVYSNPTTKTTTSTTDTINRRRLNIPPIEVQQFESEGFGQYNNGYREENALSYDIFDHFGVREIVHACFSPSGATVALLNNLKDIWIATTESMEIIQHIRLNDFAVELYFSVDGRYIMTTYSHIGHIHGFEVVQDWHHSNINSTPMTVQQSSNRASVSWSGNSFEQHFSQQQNSNTLLQSSVPILTSSRSFPSPAATATAAAATSFAKTTTPYFLQSSPSSSFQPIPAPSILASSVPASPSSPRNSHKYFTDIPHRKASPRHQELWKRHPRIVVTTQTSWELSLPNGTGGQPVTVQKILPISKHYLLLITVTEEILVYDLYSADHHHQRQETERKESMTGADYNSVTTSGGDEALSMSSTAAAVGYSLSSATSTAASSFFNRPSVENRREVISPSISLSRMSSASTSFSGPVISNTNFNHSFTFVSPQSPSLSSSQKQQQQQHQRSFPAFPLPSPVNTPTTSLSRAASTDGIVSIQQHQQQLQEMPQLEAANLESRPPTNIAAAAHTMPFSRQVSQQNTHLIDSTSVDSPELLTVNHHEHKPQHTNQALPALVRPPLHSTPSASSLLLPTSIRTMTNSSLDEELLTSSLPLPVAITNTLSLSAPEEVTPKLIARVPLLSRGELRAISMSWQFDVFYSVTSGQVARIFGLETTIRAAAMSSATAAATSTADLLGNNHSTQQMGLLYKLSEQDREFLTQRGDLLCFYRR